MKFDSVELALEELSKGKLIIVSDDEDRENEGDLVGIAELITPESINFMITNGKGLVCMPITSSRAERMGLHYMVKNNKDPFRTAFTVSIDAHPQFGVTTGISAWDRYKTIQVAMNDQVQPDDLVRPGHIFPLIAKKNGVLERTGHTEAAIDLARLAGYQPGGVIVEIIKPDGTMARQKDLFAFREEHRLPYITIKDLCEYRLKHEKQVFKIST